MIDLETLTAELVKADKIAREESKKRMMMEMANYKLMDELDYYVSKTMFLYRQLRKVSRLTDKSFKHAVRIGKFLNSPKDRKVYTAYMKKLKQLKKDILEYAPENEKPVK